MAMRGRKIPKEVQAIFDRYIHNNVRNLKRPAAVEMLVQEFNLSEEQANNMFDTFDKDMNGVMSLWEFQQFYVTVGDKAHDIVEKFKTLDVDGSGKLDADEARKGLEEMKTGTGRNLDEKEIEFFLKTALNEENQLDLGTFSNLLYRMKLYNAPAPK